MPTACSTALPAIATMTRPAKAWLMPSASIAGSSASTNHSETSAAATPHPTSTPTACPSVQPLPGPAVSGGDRSGSLSCARVSTAKTTSSASAQTTESACSCSPAGRCSVWASVGSTIAATASIRRLAIIRGACPPKRSTPWRQPPATKASPRTRSAFDRIEPTSDACTTVTSPAFSAKMQTKSSGRLPTADCTIPVAAGPR